MADVHNWLEDNLEPVSREEFSRGLRETVAVARDQGWIAAEDPGCECLTCRLWREVERTLLCPTSEEEQ